jgi:2-keto-4-pentenoate hydratase/2-oxohepta-3-ene-1,7-dioic acid hydratase in catechol pathway
MDAKMKLLTFRTQGTRKLGCVLGENVLDLNAAFNIHLGDSFGDVEGPFCFDMLSFLELGENGLKQAEKALAQTMRLVDEEKAGFLLDNSILNKLRNIHLDAPIHRPKKNIVCLGLNYAEHIAEGNHSRNIERPLPEHPIFFTKPPTTVIGPYDDIVYPKATKKLDYEVELAFIIGKNGKYIKEGDAYNHIVGYTVFNDVSARDLQRQHAQWYKGKSCDTFAPMGPYIVTTNEIGDPMNLDIWLKVNGVTRQHSNTQKMIFNIEKIVSVLSKGMTLEVGDIIATGTPSGVGNSHHLGLLNVGDVVETYIEKIGMLKNKVVAEKI